MNEKAKILIVDDESQIVELVGEILTHSGFSVLKAYSGKEGLEALKKESPDLMLLDIVMADMDGFQVCETVRENSDHNSIPILMLTGKSEESTIIQTLERGADDFITKPFSDKELLKKIWNLLDKAKNQILPSQLFRGKTGAGHKDERTSL